MAIFFLKTKNINPQNVNLLLLHLADENPRHVSVQENKNPSCWTFSLYRFIFIELFIPQVLLPAVAPLPSPAVCFQAAVSTPSPSRWITPLPHAPRGTHSHPSSSVRHSLPLGSYPRSALLPSTVKRITIWFSFFFPLPPADPLPFSVLVPQQQETAPASLHHLPVSRSQINCWVFTCWNCTVQQVCQWSAVMVVSGSLEIFTQPFPWGTYKRGLYLHG